MITPKVSFQICESKKDSSDTITTNYEGRLLGIISEEQLKFLLKNETLQNRVISGESKNLIDVLHGTLKNNRLIFAVHKEGGKYKEKTLLVSGRLIYVAHEDYYKKEIEIVTTHDGMLFIQEHTL